VTGGPTALRASRVAAMRRASSRVIKLAAVRRPALFYMVHLGDISAVPSVPMLWNLRSSLFAPKKEEEPQRALIGKIRRLFQFANQDKARMLRHLYCIPHKCAGQCVHT
jgi:hypothetical protein